MPKLKVQCVHDLAIPPVCAHPGEDLGFDIFTLEPTVLMPNVPTKVRTGVALQMDGFGFLLKERSSIAMRGIRVSGVIDAGYRGEIFLTATSPHYQIMEAGLKAGQLIPIKPQTGTEIVVVSELAPSSRGTAGYGSTGK